MMNSSFSRYSLRVCAPRLAAALVLLGALGLPAAAFGAAAPAAETPVTGPPPMPPPPPEVRRTVEAIIGEWTGAMTATVPGSGAESFAWRVVCREAALGRGAECTMEGNPSIGPLSQSCLVAYEPTHAAVHYMCVTSMGEVHDHRGKWVGDDAVEFEPLQDSMMGKPIVENVSWRFPDPKTLETTSVVEMTDGSRMTFVFTGSRRQEDR